MPSTFKAEVMADRPTKGCTFCAWVASRPKDEQAEIAEVVVDRSISIAAIYRAAKKRGYQAGDSPIQVHRAQRHGR